MTFDIEAWTSDGRGSVTVKGPLMSGQLEQGIIDITCPHCASVSFAIAARKRLNAPIG